MKKALLALIVIVLVSTGCGAPRLKSLYEVGGGGPVVEKVVEKPVAKPDWAIPAPAPAGSRSEAEYNVDQERMIIYTGRLAIVVDDTSEAIDQIRGIVESLGGYVSNSRSWYEGDPENEQLHARMTIRVPAESLDQALSQIKALANKVQQEEMSGGDVTEEYTNLGARLRNLEATETELRELLREVRESQGDADQILKVHQRLTEVRGQIEQLKGRMQYLERSVAMARVDIDILPEELKRPVIEPGWQPIKTLKNAARAFVTTLQVLVALLIWLVIFSPIIAIPVVIIRWILRRRRRRKATESKPITQEVEEQSSQNQK